MAYTIRKIQRQNGVVFSAVIKNNRGQHLKSKTFTRKGDAEAWAKRIDADAEKKEALGMGGATMPFKDLVAEYLEHWPHKDTAHQTSRANYWAGVFGAYKLFDITTEMVRDQHRRLAVMKCKRGHGRGKTKGRTQETSKKLSPATYNRYRTVLSNIFEYAITEGYMVSNPVSRIPQKTLNNKRVRYLSDEERERLFEACKKAAWPQLYTLVLMATCTGMRKSEMLNLKWRDIDFEQGLAFLATTKNGEPRVCPIPTPALAELKKIRGVGTALVFPSDKLPTQPMEFTKHWKNALSEAKIENFRFHDLRHTAASYLVMAGATLHDAAEILGHKSLETTRRYAHLSTEHKRAVAERVMNRIMG